MGYLALDIPLARMSFALGDSSVDGLLVVGDEVALGIK